MFGSFNFDGNGLAQDYDSTYHADTSAFERNKKEAFLAMKRHNDTKAAGQSNLKTVLISPEDDEALTVNLAQFILNLQRNRTAKSNQENAKAAVNSVDEADKGSRAASETEKSTILGGFDKLDAESSESSPAPASAASTAQDATKFESNHSIPPSIQSLSSSDAATSRLSRFANPSQIHYSYFDPRDMMYGGRMASRAMASKYFHSVPIHSNITIAHITGSYLYFPGSSMIYRYNQLLRSQKPELHGIPSQGVLASQQAKSKSNAITADLVRPVFLILLPPHLIVDHHNIQLLNSSRANWESSRFYHEMQRNLIDQTNAKLDAPQGDVAKVKVDGPMDISGIGSEGAGKKKRWWNRSKSSAGGGSINKPKVKRQAPMRPFEQPYPTRESDAKSLDQLEQEWRAEFHKRWMEVLGDRKSKTYENAPEQELPYKLIFLRAEDWMPKDSAAGVLASLEREMQEYNRLTAAQNDLLDQIRSTPITESHYDQRERNPLLHQFDTRLREMGAFDSEINRLSSSITTIDYSSPVVLSALESALEWIHQGLQIPVSNATISDSNWAADELDLDKMDAEEILYKLAQSGKSAEKAKKIDDTIISKKPSLTGRIANWFKGKLGSNKAVETM